VFLQGNNLTSLPESPSDWAALKALKQLSVADNRLRSLPDALASLPNLKDLWVYGNHLQTIPQTLVEMPKLAHLWLEGNPLEPEALGEALSRLHRTSGKWARKMVVGIDLQQAGGLAEEVWGFSGVRESVQVSTIVGSRDGRREGYFKLEHGVKIAFGEGQQEKEVAGTSKAAGDDVAINQGQLGVRSPRKGLVVVAFGSAPGVPNWAGVLKRVKASLNPDATKKKRPSNVTALRPETTTFDVLYVVDARRSWYTQGPYSGSGNELTEIDEAGSKGGMEKRGCSISGAEEGSEDSEGKSAANVGTDDLQLEGDFRIGTSDRTSERGLDSPLKRIRSRVAGRSTLLDAEELGIERVSSRDQSAAASRAGNQSGVASFERLGSTETSTVLPAGLRGNSNRNAGIAPEQKRHQLDDRSRGSGIEHNGSEQSGSGQVESQQNGSNGNGTGQQQLSCYYRAELKATVGGYERVLLLGDSMGASASLLFSTMATRVLSFCPQASV
jgi:hypothetical protein